MNYCSGEVIQETDRISRCAVALAPGTVYGWGNTKEEALEHAREQAERIHKAVYCREL